MAKDSSFWAMMSQMEENPAEQMNGEFENAIVACQKGLVPPCSRPEALKLLKRFAGKSFGDFWREPIEPYLPAVSCGVMKLSGTVCGHDEALASAKALISRLSERELAKDFLFGVIHGAPEYMTALACYHYVRTLPEHNFEKHYIGQFLGRGEVFSDTDCEICGYSVRQSEEPKMRFWYINLEMNFFYHKAQLPFGIHLGRALIFLKEYTALPRPETSREDYARFLEVMALIESMPEKTTPGKLRKALKQSGLLPMTNDQISSFIDLLGYLNILHPADSFGVTVKHTKERDRLDPLNEGTYFAYPVNRWTGKCGVDWESIRMLFDEIYETA